MNSEKLNIANDLTAKIAELNRHLNEAKGMAQKPFGIRFAMDRSDSVTAREEFYPIDPKDLLDLYISKVEKELAALKKEFELL
jgi:hypothetical protein